MISTVTGRAPRKTADMYIIIDGRDLVMEQVDPTGCRAGNKFTSRPNLTYTQNKSTDRVLKFLPTFLRGEAIVPYKSAPDSNRELSTLPKGGVHPLKLF